MKIVLLITHIETRNRVTVEVANSRNTIALAGVPDGFLVDMVRKLWREGKTALALELQEGFEHLGDKTE